MPWYTTHYMLPTGTRMETQLWANDPDEIPAIIKKRNIGETFSGHEHYWDNINLPIDWLDQKRLVECNHATIWLCMVAVRAGVIDNWELLHDQGLLHNIAHLLDARDPFNYYPDHIKRIRDQLEHLQKATPGFNRPRRQPVQPQYMFYESVQMKTPIFVAGVSSDQAIAQKYQAAVYREASKKFPNLKDLAKDYLR
jgi:hypothetical protein